MHQYDINALVGKQAALLPNTVNNNSFKGEKFRGLLGSSGMWGKVSRFLYHHLHTSMIFQLYKTATSVSMKVLRSSHEFSLRLSLAYLEMDKSTLLTRVCVCRFHAFQDDHAVTGGEELQLK